MNFNPALAYYNNVLYIGFEEQDNTHALRLFTSTDNDQTITENTNIDNVNADQTSTAPSLAVVPIGTNTGRSALYVGFRSNDSSQYFLYKSSTDGINFTDSTGTGERIGGSPSLSYNYSNNVLYNFFSSNDGQNALEFNSASHN